MGALRNPAGPAPRALARARRCYRRGARMIALSPGIRDGIAATGVPAGADHADAERLRPRALLPRPRPRTAERARLGLRRRASSAATSARWARPTTSPRSSRRRRALATGVTFVLQGDGKRRAGLEREVRRRGRTTCVFLPPAPRQGGRWRGWRRRRTPASRSSRTCRSSPPTRRTSCSTPSRRGGPRSSTADGWKRELVEEQRGRAVRAPRRRRRPRREGGLAARRPGRGARASAATRAALAEREFDRDVLAGRALRGARGGGGADRALLLRRQHQRPRVPARLPGGDRAHASRGGGARGARARQLLRRRLGGAVAQSAIRTCA